MGWDGGDQLRVATVDQPYRACAVRDLLQPLPRRTECPVTCMVDGLSAGPNAFSASLSGLDPGLLFVPIFFTNLGFNLGQANSYLCRCGWAAAEGETAALHANSSVAWYGQPQLMACQWPPIN